MKRGYYLATGALALLTLAACGNSDPGPIGSPVQDSQNSYIHSVQVLVTGVGLVTCIIADGSDETGISCDWGHDANGNKR